MTADTLTSHHFHPATLFAGRNLFGTRYAATSACPFGCILRDNIRT